MEHESTIVIDLAMELIETAQAIDANWRSAYLRFIMDESHYGSTASYTTDVETTILNPFDFKRFFESMNSKAVSLLQAMGKARGVVLISANSNYSYRVDFEFQSLDRWRISKLDGGTGAPEGLEPVNPPS